MILNELGQTHYMIWGRLRPVITRNLSRLRTMLSHPPTTRQPAPHSAGSRGSEARSILSVFLITCFIENRLQVLTGLVTYPVSCKALLRPPVGSPAAI